MKKEVKQLGPLESNPAAEPPLEVSCKFMKKSSWIRVSMFQSAQVALLRQLTPFELLGRHSEG